MEFKELARQRYSGRKISAEPLEPGVLDTIIDAGLAAPTAVNKQPYRIFCMDSPEAKEAIGKVTDFTFGADTFLVVGYREDGAWVRESDGRNFAIVDASIVATHIMMEIADLGLATTWVGYFDEPLLKELCPRMKDYTLIAIFPIGKPKPECRPSRLHTDRRPRAEMVEHL